tara:strand:- start:4816 stop:6867 length:2052 start_codon:yes stop_codon:yes gene_type:complete
MTTGNKMLFQRIKNKAFRELRKVTDYYKFYFLYHSDESEMKPTFPLCGKIILNFEPSRFEKKYKFIREIKKFYFSHRFDLLGSGWVENSYSSSSLGCVGIVYNNKCLDNSLKPSQVVAIPHRKRARKLENLISGNYKFINWQKDVKSGYCWNVSLPNSFALKVVGKLEGVDIKYPWEISRLQHLPQLAFFVLGSGLKEQEKAKVEFCDVCLDFFAGNPVGMGVNWACTMDVAIRASNLLVAKSLFSNLGHQKGFNKDFEKVFNVNLFQHSKFIFNHLEYNAVFPERNNNHYLSNVSGLIFCGAYFKDESQSKRWLDFAKDEFLSCLDNQFHDDGSNFEASTSYHRLSGELVFYSIAVLLNLYGGKWVHSYLGACRLTKLYKIGLFTKGIQKPDFTIPQIGDNDSGRFFKIDLEGEMLTNFDAVNKYINLDGYLNIYEGNDMYWDQNCLNHSSFINIVDSIFGVSKIKSLEANLLLALSGGRKLELPTINNSFMDNNYSLMSNETKSPEDVSVTRGYLKELTYSSNLSLSNLKISCFPDFGLTILKCDRHFYCSIYTGGVGQAGNGGHAHADFGSYDLIINGKSIVRDPGTFLYTPSEKWRNIFRSKLHNGIIKGKYTFPTAFSGNVDMNELDFYLTTSGILVKAFECYRFIEVIDNRVVIKTSELEDETIESYYSPGYGKLTN